LTCTAPVLHPFCQAGIKLVFKERLHCGVDGVTIRCNVDWNSFYREEIGNDFDIITQSSNVQEI